MIKLADLTGQRFGKLVIQERDLTLAAGKRVKWLCLCDCGNRISAWGLNITRGRTTSCGCRKASLDGMSSSEEYHIWQMIKQRCYNDKHQAYDNYGGRGITVCMRWYNSFENFYTDMGPRPSSEHTVERKDTNGNYSPNNCVWATELEQANNRRNNHRITHNDQSLTLSQWARALNIPAKTLSARIHDGGWSYEKALTTPYKPLKI